eukprot:489508_1
MDSKKDTDDSESDSTILVRVHINKEFLKRENLDCTQDVWKLAELEHDAIQLDCLRDDIPNAFRRARSFKPLFRSNEYQMKFYSYDPQKAEIEIEDDDDLQNELECCGLNLSGNSDSDDITSENKYLKLRVVFEQTSASSELQSPKLRLKCMWHSFLSNESRIVISVELEWNVARDTLDMYPSAEDTFTFSIKENLKYKSHEFVSQVMGRTYSVLSPLDANQEYEFQIKMFDEQMPSLAPSPWSDPLRIHTPSPPHKLPAPTYLQVTTLLPRLIQLRWDGGFAPEPQHKVAYNIKEHLQYGQHPFVAQYTIPTGKLSPLEPNTRHQITLSTSY